MSKKQQKLVHIDWVDSSGYGTGNWQSKSQKLKPDKNVSVGFVHNETEDYIELAPHLSKYCTNGNIVIPKSAIRKIRELA